ncbi:xanthine dehydrogenase family protein molybdopterin-binding subunit [Halomonas sp. M20]|uniref:xanthine dehydrogenase family protein molybdopterin-binding subunit n=1 Tax=Halomonas sp. M20 TaxID=2763264 RepID=UPI001D0A31BD|nr:molybdopterin cofactor-binding domain-containing protein [Halomonas sp. M20]
MENSPKLSRRAFLKGTGGLIVTFSILGKVVSAQEAGRDIKTRTLKSVEDGVVDSYLAIDKDGMVTVFSGKIDFGTGVRTGLAQIAAEELYVPLENVTVTEGDTSLTPDQGPTYGSLSIQEAGLNLRLAAATAREALLSAAAERMNAAKEKLTISGGVIKAQGESLGYGELVSEKRLSLDVNKDVRLKDPADYTIVGQSITRRGLPGKITGDFVYMQDLRVPNMAYGVVVRPPAIEATLEEVDEDSIAHLTDVVKIIRKGNFLGIVTESEWSAVRAGREIKATWSTTESLPEQSRLWEHVRNTNIVKDDVTSDIGNVDSALENPDRTLKATYDFALHTHGSIGPSCSIADFSGGKLVNWSSSQATHRLRRELAEMFSLAEEDVRCIYLEGAGCYGRNGHEDAAADASLLSREVRRPVRVQWMRHDEHGWDPKGPPTLIDLQAGIDDQNQVSAWKSTFFIPQGAGGRVGLLPASLSGLPTTAELNPGGITNDSAIPYQFPNVRTLCHRLETTPLRPSWIRSPGRMQNTFANEAFLDEIAAELGVDPIEYRRQRLEASDSRGHEVLDRLEILAKWENRPSPKQDSGDRMLVGRGVAYVKYELKRTYVGAVAEVEVDRYSGKIHVKRFFVTHDCGQIINPASVRAQIEGNIIQTTSRTLMEEVTFDREMVTSLDWATYPILRFKDVPEVVIELIGRPEEVPWGVGEPAAAIVSACISNAVFDATGTRLRSVPFKPEKVRRALKRKYEYK